MKTKYQMRSQIPYFLSNFQPLKWDATIRKTTVENRLNVE
jgi:hypothetical protein